MASGVRSMERVKGFEPVTLSDCNGLRVRYFENPTKSLENLQIAESLLFEISRYGKRDPDLEPESRYMEQVKGIEPST